MGYKYSDSPQITTFQYIYTRIVLTRILHPILALLTSATRPDLFRQVVYLKVENRILRARLPERLVATGQEKRRLLRFTHASIRRMP